MERRGGGSGADTGERDYNSPSSRAKGKLTRRSFSEPIDPDHGNYTSGRSPLRALRTALAPVAWAKPLVASSGENILEVGNSACPAPPPSNFAQVEAVQPAIEAPAVGSEEPAATATASGAGGFFGSVTSGVTTVTSGVTSGGEALLASLSGIPGNFLPLPTASAVGSLWGVGGGTATGSTAEGADKAAQATAAPQDDSPKSIQEELEVYNEILAVRIPGALDDGDPIEEIIPIGDSFPPDPGEEM